LPDQRRNHRIAITLFNHVVEITEKVDRPALIVNEQLQNGVTFGERFTNAFKYAFDQGFDNVVAIGSDSPNLTVDTLKEAIYHVEQQNIVLGPNFHEGVYLVGLNKKYFLAHQFENLPWQTTLLESSLEIFAKGQTEKIIKLDRLEDINSEDELLEYLETSPNKNTIYYLLFKIVFSFSPNIENPFHKNYISRTILTRTLRGPPTDYISNN
jgi:hypothetical protein